MTDDTFGLGPLEPLVRDPTISDILINGPHTVQRFVTPAGRRVDDTSPMVDSRLPSGSQLSTIIPPLALDGALVSIRRFGNSPLKAADLVAKGRVPRR